MNDAWIVALCSVVQSHVVIWSEMQCYARSFNMYNLKAKCKFVRIESDLGLQCLWVWTIYGEVRRPFSKIEVDSGVVSFPRSRIKTQLWLFSGANILIEPYRIIETNLFQVFQIMYLFMWYSGTVLELPKNLTPHRKNREIIYFVGTRHTELWMEEYNKSQNFETPSHLFGLCMYCTCFSIHVWTYSKCLVDTLCGKLCRISSLFAWLGFRLLNA